MIKQFIFLPLDRPKYIYNCLHTTIYYKIIFEKNKTLCFFLADWAFGGVQRIYIIFLEVRISDGPCLGKWGFLDYYTKRPCSTHLSSSRPLPKPKNQLLKTGCITRIRLASHVTRKTGQAGRDFSDNNKIKSTIYLSFYWCMNSTRRKFLSSLSKSMYSFVWFRRKNRLKCSW